MPRTGCGLSLLVQQLLILAVKPRAVDNPEQESPKILSEKRRKMGQEQGIQTKRHSSCFLSSSLLSRVEESKKKVLNSVLSTSIKGCRGAMKHSGDL